MANPNIVNSTSIKGETTYLNLSTTSLTTLLSNGVSSGKVFKVNSIIVANDDGTNTATINVSIHSAASGGGTAYKIAHTVSVAPDSTLVVIDKTTPIYLTEDKSITVQASASDDLDVVCSYEEIS